MAGPILLMILFVGSADYTEQLSGEKYPEYADYQKRVRRFLPNKYKTHKKHSNITQKH
jgi:steroid 5-alpha reductase family enzyme